MAMVIELISNLWHERNEVGPTSTEGIAKFFIVS